MNFFKRQTCWSNAEMVWLKLCIGSACLYIGSYFHDFFSHYYLVVVSVFSITVIRSLLLWFKKMEQNKRK